MFSKFRVFFIAETLSNPGLIKESNSFSLIEELISSNGAHFIILNPSFKALLVAIANEFPVLETGPLFKRDIERLIFAYKEISFLIFLSNEIPEILDKYKFNGNPSSLAKRSAKAFLIPLFIQAEKVFSGLPNFIIKSLSDEILCFFNLSNTVDIFPIKFSFKE